MLRILLRVRSDGTLASARATGHAGKEAAGGNLACAAATALLRTAAGILRAEGAATGSAPRPGSVAFRVRRGASGRGQDAGWLRGVTDFLLQGLRDLQRERPDAVALTVRGGPGDGR